MSKENETPEIVTITFTLDSEKSHYDTIQASLEMYLSGTSEYNPYVFKSYDISQNIDGIQYNGIFINISNTTEAVDHTSEPNPKPHLVGLESLIKMDKLENYAEFNCNDKVTERGLIIAGYNHYTDPSTADMFATIAYSQLATRFAQVREMGNFQTTLELTGEPKQTGMSMIPKK